MINGKIILGVLLGLLAILAVACSETGKASGVVGLVTVTTNPGGALAVLVPRDGGNVVSLGETPVINRQTPIGRYVMTLSKEDYQPFTVGVEVRGTRPVEISYELNKLSEEELEGK